MRRRHTDRSQEGFTMIELLITLAIIALLSAMAMPLYNSALYKSRRNALISDGRVLFQAFLQYQLDQGQYPPCCTPPEEAFDPLSLWPLTRNEYLGEPRSILMKLRNEQVSDYDSPDNPSTNHDFYAVLVHRRDPRIVLVLADTNEYPGHEGRDLFGIYVQDGEKLEIIPR